MDHRQPVLQFNPGRTGEILRGDVVVVRNRIGFAAQIDAITQHITNRLPGMLVGPTPGEMELQARQIDQKLEKFRKGQAVVHKLHSCQSRSGFSCLSYRQKLHYQTGHNPESRSPYEYPTFSGWLADMA